MAGPLVRQRVAAVVACAERASTAPVSRDLGAIVGLHSDKRPPAARWRDRRRP